MLTSKQYVSIAIIMSAEDRYLPIRLFYMPLCDNKHQLHGFVQLNIIHW